MKKRLKGIVTGIVFLTILAGNTVISKQNAETIDVNYNNIKIMVNDAEVVSDAEPFIYNGRTYVPARALAESLGGAVEWDAENSTVKVTNNNLYEKSYLKSMVMAMDAASYFAEVGAVLFGRLVRLEDYRNAVVLREPSNIDEILSSDLQFLNTWKENLSSDSIQKWFADLMIYSEVILDASGIEKLRADFEYYFAAIENMYLAYDSLNSYRDKKDPIYLEKYATYSERASSQVYTAYNAFVELRLDFYEYILSL